LARITKIKYEFEGRTVIQEIEYINDISNRDFSSVKHGKFTFYE
jgi:hypothetical protein